MFEVGTPEQAGVKLVETGVDIEWILRYSHLARTTKVVLNFPACLSTIKALHKYEVRLFFPWVSILTTGKVKF